ncbi:peptidase M16 [Pseudomonas sp. AFG_SD02_1510_Pfu_092]|uniref:M16 family metallopeptidase n=1 Tax=Pseudomonas sp. AFG_SD02_1510_Pfu_092 TaxID=2259497 RepID=UPI000DEF7111|nr:pitrilysin family protein [Pseudomonas sp. AFG_SD02_1510_Pfu_092]RCL28202.1 peptidase M16 [Pseudomonas sp. AFG_SD02_1510_Pfu_092]
MPDITSTAHQPDVACSIGKSRLQSTQGLDLDQFETLHTPVQAWTTMAGTGVKFVEAHGLPIVDVVLRFKAGTSQDTDQLGLAALTLYMLDEGSQRHTATQHAEQLERLGAITQKEIRLEHATLCLRSLSNQARLDAALELFMDLAANPAFPALALEKIKQQLQSLNASRERQPVLRARKEAYRHLFNGHPYGTSLGSTRQGIEAITVDDLRRFHQRAYAASNLEMVLVGDLSLSEAQAIAQRISEALPQGWAAAELPSPPMTTSATINIDQPGASSAALLALPMNVPANDPEFLALILGSEVLGGGFESRLMTELRQRRGLTYGIYSRVKPLSAGGLFAVEWEIAPHYVQGSQALVEAQMREFIDKGPTPAQLQFARKQLVGDLLRAVAQNQSLAALLTEVTQQRQPADHLNTYIERISAITPADVRRVMQRRLNLDGKVLVSVGPRADQQALPATDQ